MLAVGEWELPLFPTCYHLDTYLPSLCSLSLHPLDSGHQREHYAKTFALRMSTDLNTHTHTPKHCSGYYVHAQFTDEETEAHGVEMTLPYHATTVAGFETRFVRSLEDWTCLPPSCSSHPLGSQFCPNATLMIQFNSI